MELEALNGMLDRFEKLSATLVAISPQSAELNRKLIEQRRLGFEILRDPGNETADAYGLKWRLPDDLQALYTKFGIDLPGSNGDDSWTLAMPARYIIDRDGVIRYARVDADYTRRPEPEETLADLERLAG